MNRTPLTLALAAALAIPAGAALAEYPEGPVTFVVPWPPGDLEDVLTRMIAEDFQAAYGQPAAVLNRPGGGGGPFPGAVEVATAPADGSTIGSFVIGGPVGDCGLTGRKIIVDSYGGMARHGGGAFSGKDPTKVDRSAAYAGRYVAKNIVAAGLADRCEIQVSYAIGVAEPTSIAIDTFGTGKLSDTAIADLVREHFDLRPKGLIEMLDLKRPIYRQTAAYGHFGRELADFTWERTDRAQALKAAL